jgi:hypothetical protein
MIGRRVSLIAVLAFAALVVREWRETHGRPLGYRFNHPRPPQVGSAVRGSGADLHRIATHFAVGCFATEFA